MSANGSGTDWQCRLTNEWLCSTLDRIDEKEPHTEVAKFYHAAARQEDVLCFQVAVQDPFVCQIFGAMCTAVAGYIR